MTSIVFREVTQENWRATLQLAVHPEQQRFVAEYAPIAMVALAKAFVRPGGLNWMPYAIYHDTGMVGLIELAYAPNSADCYWIYHFFIDYRYQGQGYGKETLLAFMQLVREQHPTCQQFNLTVHPDNHRAQALYTQAGFRPTGEEHSGEPVYRMRVHDKVASAAEGV